MADRTIDLEALGLRSGQAVRIDMEVSPEPPVLGGERLELETDPISLRVDISRTSSGFALRLRGEAVVLGTCARCLGPARLVARDRRPRGRAGRGRPRRRAESPYIDEAPARSRSLAPRRDRRSALPERLICRPDCAGLCEICGISLNDVDPETHVHEREPDPRFAKLRDLQIELPADVDAAHGHPATIPRLMAVPKKRQSSARRDKRRAHDAISRPRLNECPQCHSPGCRIGSARPAAPTPVARSSPRDDTPPELAGRSEGE